jgi:hypothetical protein
MTKRRYDCGNRSRTSTSPRAILDFEVAQNSVRAQIAQKPILHRSSLRDLQSFIPTPGLPFELEPDR